MRKKLLILSMCIVAILPMLMMPTVLTKRQPKCPTYVEGDWDYIPQILDQRVCEREDSIDLSLNTDEEGWWYGSFEGESYDSPCRVVIKGAVLDDDGNILDFDYRYYTGIVNYKGKVNGKRGRLTMRVAGRDDGPGTDWHGTWVILRGKGRLRRLQGFGTFWGPGFLGGEVPVPGIIWYEGWIH